MTDGLRRRAEARLASADPARLGEMAPEQVERLVHELQVHQIELELQNEELRKAQLELLRARDRYVDLYDFAPVGYVTMDDRGLIVEANLTATDMLGVARTKLVRRQLAEFVAAEDADSFYIRRRELLETGVRQTCDLRMKKGDGTRFWARVDCVKVAGGPGTPAQFRIAIGDISEQMTLEAQLRQEQKLAAIGTLASGVAHEINNPLQGIVAYAQLIVDRLGEPGGEPSEFASEIMHEGQRIAAITRNLLAFARQESDVRGCAGIADIVQGALALIRTLIRRDQITLDVSVPDGLPLVRCHGQEIQQVLLNLLTNARDAVSRRYPAYDEDKVIRVTAVTIDRGGAPWVRTTVEDHGPGIPPDVQERIFEPFFTTKSRAVGTGLGLSVSLGIVKRHGGELICETEPGRYARFHLDLPAASEEDEAPGA